MSSPNSRVRGWLPDWAQYSGYSTKAIAAYLYAVGMAAIAALAYPRGYMTVAAGAVVVMPVALSLGRYYQSAAEVRVQCDACGEPARGESTCPHCGELTYVGGER